MAGQESGSAPLEVMRCPFCDTFLYGAGMKGDWWKYLATHLMVVLRFAEVGGRRLKNWNQRQQLPGQKLFGSGFQCWCGMPIAVVLGDDGTEDFARHLEEVGGPHACVLKASLGLTTTKP